MSALTPSRSSQTLKVVLLSSLCAALVSCDSDPEPSSPAGAYSQPAGVTPQPAGSTPQPAGVEPQAGVNTGLQGGAQETPLAPNMIISACEDFGSSLCFANEDCNPDGRCQSVEAMDEQLPCCVRGERGTGVTGDPCTVSHGQLTCSSSLCITAFEGTGGYCSGVCESDEDCPEPLPRCIPIAFSGNDSQWCTPPE